MEAAAAAYDPGTGEVLDDRDAQPLPPLPEDLARRPFDELKTADQVLDEIRQETLRMDTVARRLTDCIRELDGERRWNHETKEWDFFTGVAFDYAALKEEKERELWTQYRTGNLRSWPRESTLLALVHEEMDPVVREQYFILKEEKKRLDVIQRLLSNRMDGLRSLLSYEKETMKLEGTGATDAPRGVLDR